MSNPTPAHQNYVNMASSPAGASAPMLQTFTEKTLSSLVDMHESLTRVLLRHENIANRVFGNVPDDPAAKEDYEPGCESEKISRVITKIFYVIEAMNDQTARLEKI